MLIKCLHGFFIFEEARAGDLATFLSIYPGLKIRSSKLGFFTFEELLAAPAWSIDGGTYLGAPAIKTFSGEPWSVMRENKLVFNFNTSKVVGIETVTQRGSLDTGRKYLLSPGLLLPGSLMDGGKRVTDYAAWYSFETRNFRYSEVLLA